MRSVMGVTPKAGEASRVLRFFGEREGDGEGGGGEGKARGVHEHRTETGGGIFYRNFFKKSQPGSTNLKNFVVHGMTKALPSPLLSAAVIYYQVRF